MPSSPPRMRGTHVKHPIPSPPRVDDRIASSHRGYDSRWTKLRNWYIGRHPLCEHCAKRGITTPASEVDHIVPFCGIDDPMRINQHNLQSLCRRCHAIKTASDIRRMAGGDLGGRGVKIPVAP